MKVSFRAKQRPDGNRLIVKGGYVDPGTIPVKTGWYPAKQRCPIIGAIARVKRDERW